jgi:serine/threonine protein kinase
MTGDIVGTLRYMSPEQALAKRGPVDHRTDIYSLAVTLYELLTLKQAFLGDDAAAVMSEIAFKEPTKRTVTRPPRISPTTCDASWRTARSTRAVPASPSARRSGRAATDPSCGPRPRSSCWPSSASP